MPSKFEGDDYQSIKVFLLGEAESGTDGIASGLREYYQFSPDKQIELDDRDVDLLAYKMLVRQSALDAMIFAIKQFQASGMDYRESENAAEANKALGYSTRKMNTDIPKHIWTSLSRLWKDNAFCSAVESESIQGGLNLRKSQYYFRNLGRISSSNFVPTTCDVSLCQKVLNGVTETPLRNDMSLLEMAPLRNKTHVKQIAQFISYNTIVAYCIDVSTIDSPVDERNTRSLAKSFELFKALNASPCIKGVPVFVIFTNREELENKLTSGKTLSLCFPKYKGNNDILSATNYLIDLFSSVVQKNRFSALFLDRKIPETFQDIKNVKKCIHNCLIDMRIVEAAFLIK